MVNESLQMAEAISKFGYGIVAISIIFIIFLVIIGTVLFQNKQFTNDLIQKNQELYKVNQESVRDLKDVIKDLKGGIENMSVNYEIILNNIVTHIHTLENKYETVTCQLLENIMDDKVLSKRNYFVINKFIILTYVEKTIVAITEHFDRNGLNCDERLKLFKENIARDMEKYKNLALEEMAILEFDSAKRDKFIDKIKKIYEECFKEIRETIIYNFCSCELETTPHYFNFKQQIKNRLNVMSENILQILKEILR